MMLNLYVVNISDAQKSWPNAQFFVRGLSCLVLFQSADSLALRQCHQLKL